GSAVMNTASPVAFPAPGTSIRTGSGASVEFTSFTLNPRPPATIAAPAHTPAPPARGRGGRPPQLPPAPAPPRHDRGTREQAVLAGHRFPVTSNWQHRLA